MALNSYFDFAENDFQYFKASYDAGIVANMMGAMAQGICEKYIDVYKRQVQGWLRTADHSWNSETCIPCL